MPQRQDHLFSSKEGNHLMNNSMIATKARSPVQRQGRRRQDQLQQGEEQQEWKLTTKRVTFQNHDIFAKDL